MSEFSTVVVVEGDAALGVGLADALCDAGLQARHYPSAEAFLVSDAARFCNCLLVGLSLPGMSGLDLQTYLRTAGYDIPVIFLSGKASVTMAVQAVKSGAFDVIELPYRSDRLAERVGAAIAQRTAQHAKYKQIHEIQARVETLTGREREILELVMDGMSTKEIARRLRISPRTVEVHRSRLMRKLAMKTLRDMFRTMLMVRSESGSTWQPRANGLPLMGPSAPRS